MKSFSHIIKNIIYLPLSLPNPPQLTPVQISAIEKIPKIRDNYRNCFHIPLYNAMGSVTDFPSVTSSQMSWTHYSKWFPELKKYILSELSWMRPLGRIVLIYTLPHDSNPIHLDYLPISKDRDQIKFRAVLQGASSSLWFWDGASKVPVPEIGRKPFLMSGKFPHGMDNKSGAPKITLGIGDPWSNEYNREFNILLRKSMRENSRTSLTFNDLKLPNDLDAFF